MERTGATDRAQARLEASPAGRALLSAVIAVVLSAVAISSLPAGPARDALLPGAQPMLHATGLDQYWSVFAPNPRSIVFDLYAEVRFADGSTTEWRVPRRDRIVGVYSSYRWWKWVEYARADDRAGQLWDPAALYVARLFDRPGRPVVKVTLIRRWYDIPPPGRPTPATFNSYRYHELDVTQDLLAGR